MKTLLFFLYLVIGITSFFIKTAYQPAIGYDHDQWFSLTNDQQLNLDEDKKLFFDQLFSAVGHLVLRYNVKPFCVGSLVSTNQVLTASHCMDDEWTCEKTDFEIHSGPYTHRSSCVRILQRDLEHDQVLFEISNPVDLTHFRFFSTESKNKTKREIGETIYTFTYRGTENSKLLRQCYIAGEQRELDKTVMNIKVGTKILYPTNCHPGPTIKGDSGSPMVNKDGEIIGVLSEFNTFYLPLPFGLSQELWQTNTLFGPLYLPLKTTDSH